MERTEMACVPCPPVPPNRDSSRTGPSEGVGVRGQTVCPLSSRGESDADLDAPPPADELCGLRVGGHHQTRRREQHERADGVHERVDERLRRADIRHPQRQALVEPGRRVLEQHRPRQRQAEAHDRRRRRERQRRVQRRERTVALYPHERIVRGDQWQGEPTQAGAAGAARDVLQARALARDVEARLRLEASGDGTEDDHRIGGPAEEGSRAELLTGSGRERGDGGEGGTGAGGRAARRVRPARARDGGLGGESTQS